MNQIVVLPLPEVLAVWEGVGADSEATVLASNLCTQASPQPPCALVLHLYQVEGNDNMRSHTQSPRK